MFHVNRSDPNLVIRPALVSKKRFYPSLDNRGFSITEVMIGGSILMVILVGLTSMINFSSRSVQSIKVSTDFNSLVTLIQSALNSANTCKATMSGVSFSPLPTSAAPITVTPIKTDGGAEIAKIGSFGNTLKINRLEFNNATSTGANQYIATFHLEADKVVGGGGTIGSKTLSHDFQIALTTDASNKISGCTTSGSSDSLWQKAVNGADIYYSSGKVGIGTSSPQNTFEVMGDVTIRESSCNAGETAIASKTVATICGGGGGCAATNCTTGSHDWQSSLVAETCTYKIGGAMMGFPPTCSGGVVNTCYASISLKCKGNTLGQDFSIGDGQILSRGRVGIGTKSPLSSFHIGSDSAPFGMRITNNTAPISGLYIGVDSTDSFVSTDRGSLKLRSGNADRVAITTAGRVGIGTTSPTTTLDVNGEVKFGYTGAGCASTYAGVQRYNSATKTMEFCNGTKWIALGASQINVYQCPTSCAGCSGGAWAYYGCQGQLTTSTTCSTIEYPCNVTCNCNYVGKMNLAP